MFNKKKIDTSNIENYDIIWGELDISPTIQIKRGITRKVHALVKQPTKKRSILKYSNQFVELSGRWDNSPVFGSLLSFELKNISDSSIRLTRLTFPAANGLNQFLKDFRVKDISFFRNGYQSWSTTRSYRLKDKPLRPWLHLVSSASSNMSNLPSNTPGSLSSEMYSVITDLKTGRAFLVGQGPPFDQFFYIRLKLFPAGIRENYFELVYDFGRKMIMPGETIKLDGIIMAVHDAKTSLQEEYFKYLNNTLRLKKHVKNVKGWCTWYYYYNKISPDIIYKNLETLREKNINIDFIQIDDGYQQYVGDWLSLTPAFEGQMAEIAHKISKNGYKPGIWIAPFIADKKSELVKIHPEYILRTEHGTPIIAGFNPLWPGLFYYSLDVTNPRYEEYLRKVIYTIVHRWGYKYIKTDFLFSACMRGGTHKNLGLSRAEVLKYGMNIIRDEAGKDVVIAGCGMPLTAGIGIVDIMRIGPDTAPYWRKMSGTFLQTGAMIGARNSIRNFMARSAMNKKLWLNDPDCLMIRKKKTRLNDYQRMSQVNAIILSGGTLLYSDNMTELTDDIFHEITRINHLSDECHNGTAIPIDVMQGEMTEIYYNTAGFIGFFNFKKSHSVRKINIKEHVILPGTMKALEDVWTGEIFPIERGIINLGKMPPLSSRLFKILF